MRISPSFWQSIRVVAVAGLVLWLGPACKPAAQSAAPPKPAAVKTTPVAPATTLAAAENTSVFQELMPPKGKDPFFPNSHRRDPVPVVVARPDNRLPPPDAELILKGIVGSPSHRLALVNNAILGVGETDSVRVPNGHVKVKCLEIGEDYAVVKAEGEAQPKRLELNKKGF